MNLPDTPLGVASLGGTLAWDAAEFLAKDSAALLWKNASEDERFEWGFGIGPPDPLWQSTHKSVESEIMTLLRDIVGNPFGPVGITSAWRKPNVVALAQEIYDAITFDRLPVLANALEEVGCNNADILAHCRGPGPHVRGCWVVDLLLGKE